MKNLERPNIIKVYLSDEEKITAFREYAEGLDEAKKAELYVKVASYPDDEYVKEVVDSQMENLTRENRSLTVTCASNSCIKNCSNNHSSFWKCTCTIVNRTKWKLITRTGLKRI